MSCGCENKRRASEVERMRGLAKKYAVLEGQTVTLYRCGDGTYGFCLPSDVNGKEIVEYITPY